MTYNWQEEPQDSFMNWLLPSLLANTTRDKEAFEALSEATSGFTDVKFGVTINGIEVDAMKFFDGLGEAMHQNIEHEARKMIEEIHPLAETQELIDKFQRSVKSMVRRHARNAGIELDEDDW